MNVFNLCHPYSFIKNHSTGVCIYDSRIPLNPSFCVTFLIHLNILLSFVVIKTCSEAESFINLLKIKVVGWCWWVGGSPV